MALYLTTILCSGILIHRFFSRDINNDLPRTLANDPKGLLFSSRDAILIGRR